MAMGMLLSYLKKFGLSVNEAKAYSALLAMNEAKASDIAKSAHVPRNKIYEIMESLHKKGFVEIVPERVTRFRAVSSDDALNFMIESWHTELEEKMKTKEKLSMYLNSLPVQKKSETGEFLVYRAKKIIYRKLEEMLANAEKNALLMINSSDLRRLYPLAKNASKKISIRVLSPITAENKDISRKWRFAELRHYETQTQTKLALADEEEMLVFQTNEPTGLYSKDRQFITMLKSFYESAWEASPSAEDRLAEIETGRPMESLRYVRGIRGMYSLLPEIYETSGSVIFATTPNGIIRMSRNLGRVVSRAAQRGMKIRCMTMLTKSNIAEAKKLSSMMEIRHIDKVHAIVHCDDSRFMVFHIDDDTMDVNSEEGTGIMTNQKDIVVMMRHMLESMWEQATDIERREKELAGKPGGETIIKGSENIYRAMRDFTKTAEKEICRISTEFSLERALKHGTFEIDRKKAHRGVNIRYLMPVTKNNMSLIKEAMKFAEIRHIDFSPVRARIIDARLCIVRYGGEDIMPLAEQTCIVSDSKEYVSSMQSFFERVWLDAVPAAAKIRELETGEPVRETKILYGTGDAIKKIDEMCRNVEKEARLAINRECFRKTISDSKNENCFSYDIQRTLKEKGIKIRAITEIDESNMSEAEKWMEVADVRHVDVPLSCFKIIDGKECMLIHGCEFYPSDTRDAIIWSSSRAEIMFLETYFEKLWSDGVPAELRIEQVKKGTILKKSSLKKLAEEFELPKGNVEIK